jgi:hypothetical protein
MFVLWMLLVVGSTTIILVLALVINSVIDESSRVQVSPVNEVRIAPEESNLTEGSESKRVNA